MRKGKLSRKALIKHIRSTMPEELTELEILAYIEKAIADNVVFDEGYLWSDKETKKKIYKLSKQEALQRKDTVKRKMICINMAELYAYIAGEFGIEVELQRIAIDEESFKIDNEIGGTEVLEKISEEKLEHVCPIANLKDGRRIVIDIQNDLELLQTRSRPLDFGKGDGCSQVPKPIDVLSEEEVESVFRKIYELQEGEEFTDEYINSLNKRLSTEQIEPSEKIRRIIEDSRIQQEIKHLGTIGVKKFYRKILSSVLGIPSTGIYFHNGTRAFISTCSISNRTGVKKHSVILYIQDYENQDCYVFSKKNRRMTNITPEELYQMQSQSMEIRPAYTSEESNFQTRMIEESFKNFVDKGKFNTEKAQQVDMETFFSDEYDEEEK